MIPTTNDLIEAAKDPRLAYQPKWVRTLVHDLAYRLKQEAWAAETARETARREVTEARALLSGGPEDSDTFAYLPRALYADEDDPQRPLGKGTAVEFRAPGMGAGEGITVTRLEDGTLRISGMAHLAVIPVSVTEIRLEER